MQDYALIATAYNNRVRIYVATTTALVEEARKTHDTWPTATAALGRFLTASALMGLMYKQDERISLRIESEGPIKKMIAEANGKGLVKGDIINPHVYLKYHSGPKKGKLAVGKAVGPGFLHVTKDLNLRDYFSSTIELQSGEIGDDFTYYFAASEQTPSSVGLGVLVDTDQSTKAAGGYILQLLPGADETLISTIESVVKTLEPVSKMIDDGKTPEDILSILASKTEKILDKKTLAYVCDCSKQRFGQSIYSLDLKSLKEMREDPNGIEVVCHFCHKKYVFSPEELEEMIVKKENNA